MEKERPLGCMNMEKNKENVLFADLVARLPYGVKVEVEVWNEDTESFEIVAIPIYSVNTDRYFYACTDSEEIQIYIDEVQPYLRKMSSMTEDEYNEYENYILNEKDELIRFCNSLKFYNKYHFDYRGLIEMGLALEAPDGMYK